MRKIPLLFLIPVIALFVVVVIAVTIRLLSKESTTRVKAGSEFPNPLVQQESKPSSFLGGLLGGKATPTPTPATASDLSRELNATVDDGGAGDLNALQEEASGL